MNEQHQAIFHRLGVAEPVFLGKGATSQVYSLGNGRVVRILSHDNLAYMNLYVTFYERLKTYNFPFALPLIETIDKVGVLAYVVERHLPGYDMSTVFPKLDAAQRQAALRSFLAGLGALHQIEMEERPFGELLGWEDNITNPNWGDYLAARTHVNLKESLSFLHEDLPKVDQLIADFLQRVGQLPNPRKMLIHGDYFFGNVMCDERGELTAVFDFSPLTLVGDVWFDYAGAVDFLRVYDFVTEADVAFAKQEVRSQYGESDERTALYTTYNALYFANSKIWDPPTYRWCLHYLERYPFLA